MAGICRGVGCFSLGGAGMALPSPREPQPDEGRSFVAARPRRKGREWVDG